jgi:hypothetical protein
MLCNGPENVDIAGICREEHAGETQACAGKEAAASQPEVLDIAIGQRGRDGDQKLHRETEKVGGRRQYDGQAALLLSGEERNPAERGQGETAVLHRQPETSFSCCWLATGTKLKASFRRSQPYMTGSGRYRDPGALTNPWMMLHN